MEQLKKRVWEYSQNNPEGFTLSLETLKPVTSGICVAYLETQNSHSLESLERVIQHALEHDKIVGGWYDEDTWLYYFDSVRVFPSSMEQEAIAFAQENKQLAVFNLTKKLLINVNK